MRLPKSGTSWGSEGLKGRGVRPKGVNNQSTWEVKDIEPLRWSCKGGSVRTVAVVSVDLQPIIWWLPGASIITRAAVGRESWMQS